MKLQELPLERVTKMVDAESFLNLDEVREKLRSEAGTYMKHLKNVEIEVTSDTIICRGNVTSFFMKQVLQTILKNEFPAANLENSVSVIYNRQ